MIDHDADETGTEEAPSLEQRHYYCQNWRADVVAIISNDGKQMEQMRYSAYGTPYAIPYPDNNQDGFVDYFDVNPYVNAVNDHMSSGTYDVRHDANLDGTISFLDVSHFNGEYNKLTGGTYGRDVQSAYGHEPGYAGYWRVDQAQLSHVRNRWCDTGTGTWLSKDPAGYVDEGSLFAYVASQPLPHLDPLGLKKRENSLGIPLSGPKLWDERYFILTYGWDDSPCKGKPVMFGPDISSPWLNRWTNGNGFSISFILTVDLAREKEWIEISNRTTTMNDDGALVHQFDVTAVTEDSMLNLGFGGQFGFSLGTGTLEFDSGSGWETGPAFGTRHRGPTTRVTITTPPDGSPPTVDINPSAEGGSEERF